MLLRALAEGLLGLGACCCKLVYTQLVFSDLPRYVEFVLEFGIKEEGLLPAGFGCMQGDSSTQLLCLLRLMQHVLCDDGMQ
jgi:hypothetical protein